MRRLMTFFTGMVVGGILLWGALHYHILHTKEGLRLVPKASSSLSKTYVDIRSFTVADWTQHTDLVLALTNANQHELMESAAGNALENGINRWLQPGEQR